MHFVDEIKYKEYKDPIKTIESVVQCANCEKDLVSVVEFPDIQIQSQYVFICPCGGKSFKKKYINKVAFNPINLYVDSVDYNNEVNEIRLKKVQNI